MYRYHYPPSSIFHRCGENYYPCPFNCKIQSGVDKTYSTMKQQLQGLYLQNLFQQFMNTAAAAAAVYSTNISQSSYKNRNVNSSALENRRLEKRLWQKFKSSEFQSKLLLRQKTPVMVQRDLVLQAIQGHQVVLIISGKGTGKSSQVPQIILDQYILDRRGNECQIVCVEPTKESAESLAERVASERCDPLGCSIGYHVGQDDFTPTENASILYCTPDVFLKKLRTQRLLTGITFVILDCKNGQDDETNKIMGHLKWILPKRHDLKVLILSTTIIDETLRNYFEKYEVIFIQGQGDLALAGVSEESVSLNDSFVHEIEISTERNSEQQKTLCLKTRNISVKRKNKDPVLLTAKDEPLVIQNVQIVGTNPQGPNIDNQDENTTAHGDNHAATTDDAANEVPHGNGVEADGAVCEPSTSDVWEIILDKSESDAKIPRSSSIEGNDTGLQIAVIDSSDPNGKISPEKWLVIESKLISDIVSEKWSRDDVFFDSVNWCRGIKVISCHNKRSIEFLKTAINDAKKLWPFTNLEVVPHSTVPIYTSATIWIRPPVPSIEQILPLIKKQNQGLNTDCWKIAAMKTKVKYGKKYRLVIDNNSMQCLRENLYKIKFGLGSARIRLN